MNRVHFLGECMIELRHGENGVMHQSFSGDVYNSAVYLKRCFDNVECSIVTAVGQDALSDEMLNTFHKADLNTELVFKHPTKHAGLYIIKIDDKGERSFTYWRSDAAARTIVNFLNDDVLSKFKSGDMFFFSGISLAVIEPEARPLFWQKLEQLKQAGVILVFDPNYRARMWHSEADSKEAFNRAFGLAQIALPGIEDLEQLYGLHTGIDVIKFCQSFDIEEVIVKDGPNAVLSLANNQIEKHEITPCENVVDTTSAGDAFNGVYLGARINEYSIAKSIALAAQAANITVQHPGAIAPKQAFMSDMSALLNT
ncbi:sugar kinase [Glaciecola sp. XM2]|uniref:sugar kinase n=1 Tax=Glaciecola sp. XM2 TaxID=1914931 RepID=UPI001BDF2B1A|nr:sugar kinase [Glaciecola sp. XM2]